MQCPFCGGDIEHMSRIPGFKSVEIFCRCCNQKTRVWPGEQVSKAEWAAIDRTMMLQAAERIPRKQAV